MFLVVDKKRKEVHAHLRLETAEEHVAELGRGYVLVVPRRRDTAKEQTTLCGVLRLLQDLTMGAVAEELLSTVATAALKEGMK